ncbi:MAG: hypothetical protein A2X12_08115 [Bacteroidetes bacterium GWE2_29_8]|nr:MAG: hypothetical protein A2X12_08115 [Bacteroidetes bacterium GWE2_29_8]OFY19371.1 MAG: hypothetical protein A2X02_04815 [Bacteroidetes bacterium GWF2_29_10]
MIYNKFLFFVTFSIILILSAKAQNKDTAVLHNEEIFVIKTYEPTVIEAEKLSNDPQIKDTFNLNRNVNFRILAPHFKTVFNIDTIKPLKVGGESLTKLYNSYLKLGFGNYTTPLAELYINNLRSKKFNAGGYIKHLSSKGKIKETYYPEYSNNSAGVYGKKYNKNYILSGNIDFERNVLNYYGYDENFSDLIRPQFDLIKKNDFKQYFWGLNTKVGIANNAPDTGKINYKTQIAHYIYADNYDLTENNYKISNNINKINKRNSTFDNYTYGINLDFNYNKDKNKDTANKTTREESVLFGQPYFSINKDAVSILVGLNNYVSFKNNNSNYYFSPELNVSFNVSDIFVPYGGVSGKYEQLTYKSITQENPYFIYNDSIESPNKKISFFGGIKGNITPKIYYNFSADLSQYDNMYFFVNPENNIANNQFSLTYSNADILKLKGSVNFLIKDKINCGIEGVFYNYSLDDTIEAWQKPTLDIGLFSEYRINKKVTVKGTFMYKGERAFRFAETVINTMDTINPPFSIKYNNNKLKPYLDFNLSCEYRYSNVISAFVNINNFTNGRNYFWGNYPSQKLNFIIGVTYSL